ncbi:MAG TPA: AbrB/MazE/SpoVT family DNA-binding domain-containing protein [Firmicutes bacterium]|nr:AbrB/MazE/SpoVT family DNA-binding domain-containing protein [Bacillota bacterium]
MKDSVLTLAEGGQLKLPLAIRRKLGLAKGSKLIITLEDNEIRLRKTIENEVPRFSAESTFFRLIGSEEGPEDLSAKHDEYLAEDK